MELDRRTFKRISSVNSDAFQFEYHKDVISDSLRKDIHTYLGEYRFRIPKSSYELIYVNNHISDIHGFEPMYEKTLRAIENRDLQWKNSRREQAEYIGIQSLDEQMQTANLGDSIIWASPPGSKKDGYGDYGFIFVGKIDGVQHDAIKHITMSALRIENPSIQKINEALIQITGINHNFHDDEDCLAHPVVTKYLTNDPELVLASSFKLPSGNNETKYKQAIHILEPAIETFIHRVKNGEEKENLKLYFNVIENLADKLASEEMKPFDAMEYARMVYYAPMHVIQRFGHKPRVVAGSCGDTSGSLSSNILERPSFLQKLLGENDDNLFVCPNCHQKSPPPVKDSCPKCHYTKEEHMKKGNKTC